MDQKKYFAAISEFCDNAEITQWFYDLGRYSVVAALREMSDETFKTIAEKLPKVMQGAVDHGAPPFGEIMGARPIYGIIDPATDIGDDRLHAKFCQIMDRGVNNLFSEYRSFKEQDASKLLPVHEAKFTGAKRVCDRMQALFKKFGAKHPLGSIKAFGDDIADKNELDEMCKFFTAESLEAGLPKPDTSEEDAFREEMESYGKPAAMLWAQHESTFDEFDDALRDAADHTLELEKVDAFFNPLLEKFHAFDQGDMRHIKEILDKGREKYGSIDGFGGLNEKFNELGAGYQEQKDALFELDRKEVEFNEFRAEIATKIDQQIDMLLMITQSISKNDVEGRVAKYQLIEKLANVGLSFDSDNKSLIGHAKDMGDRIAKDIEAHANAVESAVWPGHAEGFNGKADKDELAAAALKDVQRILKKDTDKLGWHFFAAAVAGNWHVSRRNILQQATELRVTVWVARTAPEQPGLATVVQMDVIAKTVKEEPPFSAVSARTWTAYRMPIGKIEKAATVIDKAALKAGKK